MEKSPEFLPNVLNYRHTLFGMSYNSVIGIVIVLAASSVIARFSLFASAIIAIAILPLMVFTGRKKDSVSKVVNGLYYRIRRKKKIVVIEGNIGMEEWAYFRRSNFMAAIFKVSGINLYSRSVDEIHAIHARIARSMNQIGSNISIISLPMEEHQKNAVKDSDVKESDYNNNLREEYLSLVDYAVSGVYYQKIYIILKRRMKGKSLESSFSQLGQETKSLMDNMSGQGFRCSFPDESEVREILGFIN